MVVGPRHAAIGFLSHVSQGCVARFGERSAGCRLPVDSKQHNSGEGRSAIDLTLTLAHISDAHLGPLVGFSPRMWGFKRFTGFYNWQCRRRHVHLAETLAAIVADMRAQAPDHIAVTGDLTNLGLPGEIEHAADWLAGLGSHLDVTVIPGNHDVYVAMGSDPGVMRWRSHMQSHPAASAAAERGPGPRDDGEVVFPFVRRIGPIALIGLNSAVPMPPFIAAGHLGGAQLERLREVLSRLGAEGMARVVLIHHPPLEGQAPRSRGLRDAAALQSVLADAGAELVLHGHNHVATRTEWPGPTSAIPVVGVPSASLGRPYKNEDLARYHLYRFEIAAGRVGIELIARGLASPGGQVAEIERQWLVAA